jgi:fumarylacetoacetase
MNCWKNINKNSDFSIYNIPFGVADLGGERQIVSRIGDFVIILDILQDAGAFSEIDLPYGIFINNSLNPMIALGKGITTKIRLLTQRFFSDKAFADRFNLKEEEYLFESDVVQMVLSD